jgi:lysophospholipase L1-like esterase
MLEGSYNPAALPRTGDSSNFLVRHAENLAAARGSNPELVFLGDSITEQWSVGNARGTGPWRADFASFHPLNLGISRNTTSQVLWQLEHGELTGLMPQTVVLMIGTNNVGFGQTAEQVAGGIAAVVTQVRADLPQANVLLLGILPRGQSPNPFRVTISQVNARLAALDDGKHVHFLDTGSLFLHADQTISRDIMWDYLHLTGKGYHLLGREILMALRSMPVDSEPGMESHLNRETSAQRGTASAALPSLVLSDKDGEATPGKEGSTDMAELAALKAQLDKATARADDAGRSGLGLGRAGGRLVSRPGGAVGGSGNLSGVSPAVQTHTYTSRPAHDRLWSDLAFPL